MLCITRAVALVLLAHSIGLIAGELDENDEEYDPYTTKDPAKREPTPCEICKYFVTELQTRLDQTSSKEIIRMGHGLVKKKQFKYQTSETRLIEALQDPHICDRILQYNVHAEREGSLRYAKGQSETMGTLHGLVNKGVKVDLGIPLELWDQPSAEVSKMQRSCYQLAEKYEEDIEEWYFHHQERIPLSQYVCQDRYLKHKNADQTCMQEHTAITGEETKKKTKKKKGKKSKKGDPGGSTEVKDEL